MIPDKNKLEQTPKEVLSYIESLKLKIEDQENLKESFYDILNAIPNERYITKETAPFFNNIRLISKKFLNLK